MSDCQEIRSDSIITFKENKSSVTFHNPGKSAVLCVDVDGCLLVNEEACDKLLCHAGKNYYIELKGRNNVKALQQIASTIEKINKDFGGDECIAVISSTKVPMISDIQKAYIKLRKRVPNMTSKPIVSSSGVEIKLE